MSKRVYKKAIASSMGIALAATSIPVSAVYADESTSDDIIESDAPAASESGAGEAEDLSAVDNTGVTLSDTDTSITTDNNEEDKVTDDSSVEVNTEDDKKEDIRTIVFKSSSDHNIINPKYIDFKTSDNKRIVLPLVSGTSSKLNLAELSPNQRIDYRILMDGYKAISGSFNVEDGEVEQLIDLEVIDKVAIDESSLNKVYGDDDFNLIDYLDLPNKYDGNLMFDVISGSDVVSVSEKGSVSLLKSGNAILSVRADRTDKFSAIDAQIPITVSSKQLGSITSDLIEWSDATKVYDGSDTVELSGVIKQSVGLLGNDVIRVKSTGILSSVNVGKRNTIVDNIVFEGDTTNYRFKNAVEDGPKVSVLPKEILLSVKDIQTSYASKRWSRFIKGDVSSYQVEDLVDVVSLLNKEEERAFNKLNLKDFLVLELDKSDYKVGTFKDKITLSVSDANAGNFKLVLEDTKGDVTITADERDSFDLWNEFSIDYDNSQFVSQVEDITYVKPGGKIAFKINENSVYNKLNIKSSNLGNDTYDDKIVIPTSSLSTVISGSFYLSDTNDEDTRSSEFPLPSIYKVDAEVPVVDFASGSKTFASILNFGETVFNSSTDVLEFAKTNSSSGYNLSVSSFDDGSGIKSLKYSVVKVVSDDDAKNKIREAALADDTNWASVVNGTIHVDGTDDGYYIVLVKVKDNVGNEAVYSSNGMMIDKANPYISIKGLPKSDSISYNDIEYTVELSDPVVNGVASGIDRVDVLVKADGKVVKSDKTKVNSFSLTSLDLYGVSNIDTFKELELAKEEKIFNGIISADSNDISLEVIAYDGVGNVVSSNEISGIKIDKTKASVVASYEEVEVKNGKYVAAPRKISVDIVDKNYNEEAATVVFSIDGSKKEYSIKAIREGKVAGLKLLTDRIDSESDQSISKYSAKRTNSYVFEVGESKEEHIYAIDFYYVKNDETFKTQFVNGIAKDGFVVDNSKPELTVDFEDSSKNPIFISTKEENRVYSRSGITPVITIKEANFDPSDVVVIVTSKDVNGKDEDKYSVPLNKISNLSNWKHVGNKHYFALDEFNADSNYTLAFEYTDLAGNKVSTESYYFTVDKTAPKGAIILNANNGSYRYDKNVETAAFEHVFNDDVSVVSEKEDLTSGLLSSKYYLYYPDSALSGSINIPRAETISKDLWQDWNEKLPLVGDQNIVVYQRLEDKAGNVSYHVLSDVITVDKSNPVAPVIELATQSPTGVFGEDVSLNIHAEDSVANNSYSGLSKVQVDVLNGATVTQSKVYDVGAKSSRVRTFNTDFVVDSNVNNSNNIVVRVTATDWAGRTSVSERKVSIDKTSPRIEIVWDNNSGRSNRYYNSNRTATIRVYERNFNPNASTISVKGGNAQISSWTLGNENGISDDNVNIATVTFVEDGDYTFDVSVSDLAGNKNQTSYSDVFTIDKTVPTVNVSWDKSLLSGRFVNSVRTATITVNERNFDARDFTADVKASLEKQGIAAPSIGAWSSNGDIHTAVLSFANDGEYSFALNFEDMAGNKSTTYSEETFVVDLTNPEIVFENITEGSSNKGSVLPVIRFNDRNYDKNGISLKLSGYRHAERDVTGAFVETGNGGYISLDIFNVDKDIDDVYTLVATMTDKAGNKSSKSIIFSVNRFGSNYYFSKETTSYLDKYYHNREKDIVIHEINTDRLKNNSINVIKDGSVVTLSNGDYTVRETFDKGWKEYIYTVKSHVFKDEGHYEITIESEDEAGNKQSNKIKEKPASFVIDKTVPSAVVTGIEDGAVYNSVDRSVGISVSDNILVKKASILVDGEVVSTYNSDDLEKEKGSLTHQLKQSNSWQTISVEVEDEAGNKTVSKEFKVLVTSDTVARAVNNIWFKAVGGGGLATLGFAWLFLMKNKKRKKE